jgi:hypothetical protein
MQQLLCRIEHAWDCIQAFKAERQAFVDAHPYRVWQETESHTGHQVVYVEETAELPPELAFHAGDCIHNLRATLDNLVYEMPNRDPDRSAFVILDHPPVDHHGQPIPFEQKAGPRLKGINSMAIAAMESLQPYQATQPSYGSPTAIGIQLRTLEQLWNRDKHRAPSLVASFVAMTMLDDPGPGWHATFRPAPQGGGLPFHLPTDILRGHHELWRVVWTGEGEAPEVQLNVRVATDVVFDEGMPAPRHPVEALLIDLHNCVRYDVLLLFEQFL